MSNQANHYDYAIDPQGNSTPNKVLRWVGHDRRVLELGTAAGIMTRAMREQGCTVTGIEYIPAMAELATPHCERMIVGDIETLDLAELLGEERFDVLVAADVLEHLRDPWQTLERLRAFIAPGGHAILSIPHIGHAAVTSGLIGGRFDYRDKGLLDRTHLRFFTRPGIEDMLLTTGWLPVAWESHRVAPLDTEFASHWLRLPPSIREHLDQHPDSDIYQFIIKAVPAGEIGWQQERQARIQQLADDLQARQRDLARLTEEHTATVADLREHQKAFGEARAWIAQLQQEQADLQQRLDEKEHLMADMQSELDLARQASEELQRVSQEHEKALAELSRFKRGLFCLRACLSHWLRKKP
ncbi:MAG: methyltransferase domain-containing protein [Pseudomonadota bacterium]